MEMTLAEKADLKPAAPTPQAPCRFCNSRLGWTATIALAVFTFAAVVWITRKGPGFSPDSRGYLMAAECAASGRGVSILNGDGTLVPLTHLAPLYAVVLTPGEWTGISAAGWSRWHNAFCFAAMIVLVAGLARRAGASWPTAFLSAALTAASLELLQAAVMVWSEPTFLAALVAMLMLLGGYLDGGSRWQLALAAVCAAIACGARYSGVSIILAAGPAILINPNRAFTRRIIDVIIFGVIACTPMGLWAVRNLVLTGNAANRQIIYHPPNGHDFDEAIKTFSGWLLPRVNTPLMWAGFGIVVVLSVFAMIAALFDPASRRPLRPDTPPVDRGSSTRRLIAIFMSVYILFIIFTISFVDAHTPLDMRILAPLQVCAIVLLPLTVTRLIAGVPWRPPPATGWRLGLAAAIGAILFTGMAARAAVWVYTAPKKALGYNSPYWRNCELGQYVRTLPAGATIYTNGVDVLYFVDHRFSKPIPALVNAMTRREDGTYIKRLRLMRNDLRTNGGYVVYFTTLHHRSLPEPRLKSDLPLILVHHATDGNVYVMRDSPTTGKN